MEQTSLFELQVDQEAHRFFSEIAKWARFLAFVGLIFTIFGFFIAGIMAYLIPVMDNPMAAQLGDEYQAAMNAGRAGTFIFYAIFAAISVVPYIYLLKFANRMRAALASSDQGDFNSAVGSLKSTFKFVGILTIICLSILVFALCIIALGVGMSSTTNI